MSKAHPLAFLALLLCSVPASAQLPCFNLAGSTKVGLDRNGGSLDPGDLIDWTIEVPNTGTCASPAVTIDDALEAQQGFVAAGQGGVYDAGTHSLHWDSTTTPALASIPAGGTATVTLTTSLGGPPSQPPFCNQAIVFGFYRTDDPSTGDPADRTCLGPTTGTIPTLAAVVPCRGTKRGGTSVVLTGSNFEPGATVTLGGVPATVVSLASDRIDAIAGEHPAVGSVDVVVRNPGGGSATLPGGWVYTPVPFPIRLHGSKRSGKVWLVWTDTGSGPNTVERSTDPLFGCGVTFTFVAPPPEFEDDTLDDGQLWFYRVE